MGCVLIIDLGRGVRGSRRTPRRESDRVQQVVMRIGHLEFSAPFCQAGLAGYSDMAMRVVARRRGCGYAVTEALLDQVLLRGGRGLEKGAILCEA